MTLHNGKIAAGRRSRWPRSAREVTSSDAEQALVGAGAVDELFAHGRRAGGRGVRPGDRSARLGGVQTPRRRRADRAHAAAARRPRALAEQG